MPAIHYKASISDLAQSIYGVTTSNYLERVDQIRNDEYPATKDRVYLDHAGTTLAAKSLYDKVKDDFTNNIYGNPHSHHHASRLASHRIEDIRERTLRFFNADPEHFDLIFVQNASAAIKMVAECFRDCAASHKLGGRKGFWYGYHRDCHTSLVGVREATRGEHHCFASDDDVEAWVNNPQTTKSGRHHRFKDQLALFSYPGQSNMTGRRLPLDWPAKIRNMANTGGNIYTLFDAAALAVTSQLNLSNHTTAPDFVCVSFYKIFGFPDLGALIVRKEAGNVLLHRRIFCGGTVDMVISLGQTWHAKKAATLHERLEDGTLPFHNIIALGHAMDVHSHLYGSMSVISAHTALLTRLMYDGLVGLRHANGLPVAVIYNDTTATYGDPRTQGATIAFNLLTITGQLIGYADVEKFADQHRIAVRSGALCNPGGFATYLNWTAAEMKMAYDMGHSCSEPEQVVNGKSTGVVRIALGAMSNTADVKYFLDFVREFYVNRADPPAPVTPSAPSFDSGSGREDVDFKISVCELNGKCPPPMPPTRRSTTMRRLRSALSLRNVHVVPRSGSVVQRNDVHLSTSTASQVSIRTELS